MKHIYAGTEPFPHVGGSGMYCYNDLIAIAVANVLQMSSRRTVYKDPACAYCHSNEASYQNVYQH